VTDFDLDDAPGGSSPPPKRRNDQREHRFQGWADRYIDRVVLPPAFVTAIDHASMTTQNARSRAQGRGVKFGFPDHLVIQNDPLVIGLPEFKRGGKLDARQVDIHAALRRAGAFVATCETIMQVYQFLVDAGFRLHGNALNMAVETDARAEGSDRKAARPKKPGKPRAAKPSSSYIKRMNAIRGRTPF
jgi:hypothetical protein